MSAPEGGGMMNGAVIHLTEQRPAAIRKHGCMFRRIVRMTAALMLAAAVLAGTAGPLGELQVSAAAEAAEEETETRIEAPDFTLPDQYGQLHTLSDYRGKVVFLNLWTTWCTYCVQEMPDIEELYQETGKNEEDVIILGLACPSQDTVDEAGIISFLEEKNLTYPVLIDSTEETFATYISSGFPTTWLIRADGTLMGYYAGMLTGEQMRKLIEVTQEEADGESV